VIPVQVFEQEVSEAGKGGYGALFADMVQILLRAGAIAVQFISKPESSHGAGFQLHADARFDSRSFSEGWCPGARTITNLS